MYVVITSNEILERLNKDFDLDLTSRSRLQFISNVRFMYFFLARKFTEESLSRIGGLVDRDHSTALYGTREFENILRYEPKLKRYFDAINREYYIKINGSEKNKTKEEIKIDYWQKRCLMSEKTNKRLKQRRTRNYFKKN